MTTAVFSTIPSTTVPFRNTVAYKTPVEAVIDTLDDSGEACRFEEKEARRQMRLVKASKEGRIKVRILASCGHAVFLNTPPDGAPHSSVLITTLFITVRVDPRLARLVAEPRTVSAAKEVKCKVSKLYKTYHDSENPVVSSHHCTWSHPRSRLSTRTKLRRCCGS